MLRDAVAAAKAVGEKPDPRWSEVSDNIKFHYMPDGTIKENATYNGEAIKQADANLLAYPLGVVTDPKRVRQDLEYYSQKIDKNGPAMGNAILAILYAQLGDSEKAYEYFSRSYIPHKRPPFGVLSETAGGNNPYFCTGAGGLLQAVLYGFGGLRVTDAGIVQHKSVLPSKVSGRTRKPTPARAEQSNQRPQRRAYCFTNVKHGEGAECATPREAFSTPSRSKEKICALNFKICPMYFKICQTYFRAVHLPGFECQRHALRKCLFSLSRKC